MPRRPYQNGFTLVEVMIAMTLFAFVGIGLVLLSLHVRRLAENNVYQAMAYTIAQGYLEQLKSMAWFDLVELDDDKGWMPREPIHTISGIEGSEDAPLHMFVRPRSEWPTGAAGEADPFAPFDFDQMNGLSNVAFQERSGKIARETGRNARRYILVTSPETDGTDGVIESDGRQMRMVLTPEIIPLPGHEDYGLMIHLHVLYEVPSSSGAMHQHSFTSSAIRTRFNSF